MWNDMKYVCFVLFGLFIRRRFYTISVLWSIACFRFRDFYMKFLYHLRWRLIELCTFFIEFWEPNRMVWSAQALWGGLVTKPTRDRGRQAMHFPVINVRNARKIMAKWCRLCPLVRTRRSESNEYRPQFNNRFYCNCGEKWNFWFWFYCFLSRSLSFLLFFAVSAQTLFVKAQTQSRLSICQCRMIQLLLI